MEKKNNPWKKATFVLSIILVLLFVSKLYEIYEVNVGIRESICNKIVATPAWATQFGDIFGYGVVTTNSSNMTFSNKFTENLINNKMFFVYNPDCSACKLQIKIFGEENFDKLKQNNLALDCSKIEN